MNLLRDVYHTLVKVMVNLKFAVVLLSLIALIATYATVQSGGEERQVEILRGPIFSGLMVIFMTALTLAVASRWPWKKTHTGWIMTHTGLVLIVIGHGLTAHLGREGRAMIWEGAKTSFMEQDEHVLIADVTLGDGQRKRVTIGRMPSDPSKPGAPAPDAPIVGRSYAIPGGDTIVLDRFWPTYDVRTRVTPNPAPGAPFRPAVELEIRSSEAHAHGGGGPQKVRTWLATDVADMAARGFGDELKIYHERLPNRAALEGLLSEGAAAPARTVRARVIAMAGEESVGEVLLEPALAGPQPVGQTGYRIAVVQKFDRFRMEGRPVEAAEGPINPAVYVEITDAAGRSEKRFVFPTQDIPPANTISPPFQLRYEPSLAPDLPRGSLLILEVDERRGEPTVVTVDPEGRRASHPFEIGRTIPLPWAGVEAAIVERHESADVTFEPWCSSYAGLRPALHLRVVRGDGQPEEPIWVVWNGKDEPTHAHGSLGPIELRYGARRVPLGFTLQLDDFKIETYEGTNNPMTYESYVTVRPHDADPAYKYHIYMNHPLTHDGWTFFQADYDHDKHAYSVFQVSFDPGWRVVYLGYTLTILGLFFIVYLKPIMVRREAERLAAAGLARKAAATGGRDEHEHENKQEATT